ncbi:cytochrome P450 [Trametes polyzona]|nr:cytochrome P450 [Trametes polyzona]
MFHLVLLTASVTAIFWLIWKYCKQAIMRSPLDNIPGPPSDSLLYGNLRQILQRYAWPLYDHFTETYPGVVKLTGPLGHRMLYVFDPAALHNIVVKDQYVFEESQFFVKFNLLNFGPGLVATLGDHHRKQRKLLNPVFSIAHMRQMLPTFHRVTHKLREGIARRVAGGDGPVEVDIIDWMGRVALELIGQSGLGYSFDPLVADSADEFCNAVKSFQPLLMQMNFIRRLYPYVPNIGSPWMRRKIVEMIPNKTVQRLKTVIDTLHERAVAICEEKKRILIQGDEAFKNQVGEGKDIMSILLRANMMASAEDKLPDEEIVGQVATFIFAAMDTTSNSLSMTFSLLAEHPYIQEKLRAEILEATNGSTEDLDYDTLVGLPYLDAVCRETLRLHPPVTSAFRETRKDAVLPLSQPIIGVDGSKINEIFVPEDTTVIIGIYSSNRNKAIWGEDALEWKPKRWLNGLPDTVSEAKIPGIYSNLMTFLGGGRACIGFKFSQLEMKVVIAHLLTTFKFATTDKPVKWNLAGIRFPTVGDSTKPSLPLKLSMYKEGLRP